MGRDLMEKVNELADEVGMKCYLECGTTKRGFYEKMGYRLVDTKQLQDPVDSTRDPLDILLMVRTPKKPIAPETGVVVIPNQHTILLVD